VRGRLGRLGDEPGGKLPDRHVAALRCLAQQVERLVRAAPVPGHHDALGLLDHRQGLQPGHQPRIRRVLQQLLARLRRLLAQVTANVILSCRRGSARRHHALRLLAQITGTLHDRWRLFGRIPVMSASGPDIDRSAAGRVALDSLLVPTAWLQEAVTWRTGDNDNTVVAEWHVGEQTRPGTLTVGPDGALRSLTMPRWAQPGGHPWGEYPCGGTFADETDFDGVKLNRTIRAGYFYGTDKWDSPAGEFFRAEITQASFI
jgi:Family of unknown function (DUF6920)